MNTRVPPTADAERDLASSDRRLELIIGRFLQIGVLLAATVVIIGGAVLLAGSGQTPADFGTFQLEPEALRSVGGVVRGALSFNSLAVVQLGLVLLIVTPVIRVAITVVAFIIRRDHLYTAMTVLVLSLLLYGLL